jgi:hypothetical protein
VSSIELLGTVVATWVRAGVREAKGGWVKEWRLQEPPARILTRCRIATLSILNN